MSENKTATLEENFGKIEEILSDLERSDISIEDAFNKYSEGVELLRNVMKALIKLRRKY